MTDHNEDWQSIWAWPSQHPGYNCSASLCKHCFKQHFSLPLTFPLFFFFFLFPENPQMFLEQSVYVIYASAWREQFAQVFFSPNKTLTKLNGIKGWTPGSCGIDSFHHHLTDKFREALWRTFCFLLFFPPHNPQQDPLCWFALDKKKK